MNQQCHRSCPICTAVEICTLPLGGLAALRTHAAIPTSNVCGFASEYPVGRSHSNLNLLVSRMHYCPSAAEPRISLSSAQWGSHAATFTSNVYRFTSGIWGCPRSNHNLKTPCVVSRLGAQQPDLKAFRSSASAPHAQHRLHFRAPSGALTQQSQPPTFSHELLPISSRAADLSVVVIIEYEVQGASFAHEGTIRILFKTIDTSVIGTCGTGTCIINRHRQQT